LLQFLGFVMIPPVFTKFMTSSASRICCEGKETVNHYKFVNIK
jgi:hypothetical protein